MFCYQCEETNNGGCKVAGICGKTNEVSNLEDDLIYIVKLIAQKGENNEDANKFIIDALFTTITNANFSEIDLKEKIEHAKKFVEFDIEDVKSNSGVLNKENEDIGSLKEILIYGLKGLAAYLHHAVVLGYSDEDIYNFVREALAATLEDKTMEELLGLVLKCGEFGVKTMALLDKANTETFGKPEITKVSLDVGDKPGILISGHDLKDLHQLLEQTKESRVDVYTHGEMLPAHAYPKFKEYDNFKGNYGGSWWKQKDEFEKFNGPILMTTNCLVPPKDSYKERLFVTGVVAFNGLKRINALNGNKDFREVIEKAKTCSSPERLEDGDLTIGFGHDTVLGLADKVVAAVKSGKIKKFVVMAGCDGRHKEREYYEEFAKALPDDSVILTAGCAKYRYNKLGLGDIDGIPRVLDAGQCNDCYSLVVVALKLVEVFDAKDVNELPIVFNIAWYEQKAVLVLLALLHLGVKNIHLGPRFPAFVSKNVLNVLIEKFNIGGITNVENDIKTMI